jgi:hypothetical protein
MGKAKIGDFEGRVPFYQAGDLRVFMPVAGYPGKTLGPAYVLITRLVPGMAVLSDGGLGVGGDFLTINPASLDSMGNTFRFKYIVRGKPPVEEMSAGGHSYKPEDGRVFLLDLSTEPPSVSQVKVEMGGLLPRPDQDATLDELKAAVEKLADRDQGIRDFLNRIEKR